MQRLLLSLSSFALVISLTTGSALAKPHHDGMMTSGHPMFHATYGKHHHHANHKYGNDTAQCRDAKGRFVKLTNGRCLAK